MVRLVGRGPPHVSVSVMMEGWHRPPTPSQRRNHRRRVGTCPFTIERRPLARHQGPAHHGVGVPGAHRRCRRNHRRHVGFSDVRRCTRFRLRASEYLGVLALARPASPLSRVSAIRGLIDPRGRPASQANNRRCLRGAWERWPAREVATRPLRLRVVDPSPAPGVRVFSPAHVVPGGAVARLRDCYHASLRPELWSISKPGQPCRRPPGT